MDDELISIIVPVYNVEKYLRKCIESIINQTYTNIEVILVNDGSTDTSYEICNEYLKKDKRIKLINKTNGGLSDARNKGIDIAKGKYIGFVDSDDYIAKNMYEVLHKSIKEGKADIAICDYKKVYEDTNIIEEKNKGTLQILEKEEAIKELIIDNNINDYAWNKLYKIELFNNIRYPFGKKMEDMGTTFRLIDKSNRIAYNDFIGYYYLQRSTSILGSVNEKFILDLQEMKFKKYTFLKEKYPQFIDFLNIYKMNFLKYYYMYMVDSNNLQIMKLSQFKDEYKFYKNNYFKYRKKLDRDFKKKIENLILYINLNLFIYLYRRNKYVKRNNTNNCKNENKKSNK